MISSPAPQEQPEIRIKEEVKYSFINEISKEARRIAKGCSTPVLQEQDCNSPTKRMKKSATESRPMSELKRKHAARKPTTPGKPDTPGKGRADYSHIKSKVSVGRKRKSPAPSSESRSAQKANNGMPKIYEKTTKSMMVRQELNEMARQRKRQTPAKSRFSTHGSLYYDGNRDSPVPMDFLEPTSTLSNKGGYWSRLPRAVPKPATEVAPLEDIGLAHTPMLPKPMSFTRQKRPSVVLEPSDIPEVDMTKPPSTVNSRRQSVSMQVAHGISNGLSSSNAKLMETGTTITQPKQLTEYQMKRAFKILGSHLDGKAVKKILKSIAIEATGKSKKELSEEDLANARDELENMLADAVKEHCQSWWTNNMKETKIIKLPEPKETEGEVRGAAGDESSDDDTDIAE